jgi:osmotically-inducible protein OsmY
MRDYDADFRNRNGIQGSWQNRDWRGASDPSWSASRYGSSRGGEWSSRPRYPYGAYDRGQGGQIGSSMQERGWGRERGYGGGGERFGGSYGGYGQDYEQRNFGGWDESRRYESPYEQRGRTAYGREYNEYGREGEREPGVWDRFKGEMREGWERLRGEGDRNESQWGRDYGNERREPGLWDQTKREAREGWDWLKGSFSGRGPKGYTRSDERIREDVCDRLAWHPEIDASDIEVTVTAGEVTLAGKVPDRRSKRLSEDVVEDIQGVRDVSNQLRVDRTAAFEGSSTTDGNRTRTMSNATSTSRSNATR